MPLQEKCVLTINNPVITKTYDSESEGPYRADI